MCEPCDRVSGAVSSAPVTAEGVRARLVRSPLEIAAKMANLYFDPFCQNIDFCTDFLYKKDITREKT